MKDFTYNHEIDIYTIKGNEFAGGFFDMFNSLDEKGDTFRIFKKDKQIFFEVI